MNPQPKFLSYVLIRLEEFLFIAIAYFTYKLGPKMLGLDSDLGRHLTIGNYILSTHSIPRLNILSYTKPFESRPPYEWISQILISLANKLMGLDGVILLFALVIAITFTLIYLESVKASRYPITSLLLTTLGMIASSIHWLPRPHIFSLFFLVIWVSELEKARNSNNKSNLILFPVIMLVWANMHGGFIFGLLAWFAYFAGSLWEKITKPNDNNDNWRRFALIGAYSFAVSIITPDGWGNWKAVLGNNSAFILSNTLETQSPNFYKPEMWPFLFLLAISLAAFSLTQTRPHTGQVFLVTGMAIMGLYMSRNIPLFAVIIVPILSQSFQGVFLHFKKLVKLEENLYSLQPQIFRGLWSAIFLIILIGTIGLQRSTNKESVNQFSNLVFPVEAMDWLKKNPQKGNMFNEFNWGGYMEMRIWPKDLVFLDSQTDFYGEAFMREYQQVISAQPNWNDVIEKYNIQWLLVGTKSPIAQEIMRAADGWNLIYSDHTAVIYRKK